MSGRPDALVDLLRKRVQVAGKKGVVLSFPSMLILKGANLRALNDKVRVVYLTGTEEQCRAAFLAREESYRAWTVSLDLSAPSRPSSSVANSFRVSPFRFVFLHKGTMVRVLTPSRPRQLDSYAIGIIIGSDLHSLSTYPRPDR